MKEQRIAFQIGSIPVHRQLVLAPMDGISDMPFRSLCRRFGSGLSYLPFLHAREVIQGHIRPGTLLQFQPEERPVIFQLYDNNVDYLLQAAQLLQEHQPDAIDVNMACSIRSISARGAGAGLLREPLKVGKIIRLLSSELDVPITAKIRLGWDASSQNYLDIARAIEDNGGAMIAVHARTRHQRFDGKADWDAIANIKQISSIPIIGNGDVRSVADINRLASISGCDAIMIGRAAIGNPWIFEPRSRGSIPKHEVAAVIAAHLEDMVLHYAESHAVLQFRKHLVRYIEPFSLTATLRKRLLTSCDLVALNETLHHAGLAKPSPEV